MRIALVDVNFGRSSTGKIVADLSMALQRRGHDTHVYFGRGPEVTGDVTRISRPWEVGAHALATRVTGLTDGFSPFATRRLIECLDRFKPDVVHLHDIHGYFLNIGQLCSFLKERSIATVWTFHCEFMYTGRCGYALDCNGWRSGCIRCPHLSRYPASWFFDFANSMYLQKKEIFEDFRRLEVVVPSNWLADRVKNSIVGGLPTSVVFNGIDIKTFKPRDRGSLRSKLKLKDNFCVLSVGSSLLSERKGGRWVVELAKRFDQKDIVFLMVGVDRVPSEVPSNVLMFPPIDDQDLLAEFYSLADVLLLSSERETFSMVTAEALACGLPVIGFDSGAPKEIAPEGYGSFVPYGDLAGLEALLLGIYDGRVALKSRTDCAKFASYFYSVEAMVRSYEGVYNKVLKSSQNLDRPPCI